MRHAYKETRPDGSVYKTYLPARTEEVGTDGMIVVMRTHSLELAALCANNLFVHNGYRDADEPPAFLPEDGRRVWARIVPANKEQREYEGWMWMWLPVAWQRKDGSWYYSTRNSLRNTFPAVEFG